MTQVATQTVTPVPIGNSRTVQSSQQGVHVALDSRVQRHLGSIWRQPFAEHNVAAFAELQRWREQQDQALPLWLDSGCGTGLSSYQLAKLNPQALVIGVDQSSHRLQRGQMRFEMPSNGLLLRAECADLWRLMLAADYRVQRHFLLYPNPWPKPGHLPRRWHGHPVFPDLLALSEHIELRSNWRVYVDEMAQALSLAGRNSSISAITGTTAPPISDFEDKYRASGHDLWQLTTCQD